MYVGTANICRIFIILLALLLTFFSFGIFLRHPSDCNWIGLRYNFSFSGKYILENSNKDKLIFPTDVLFWNYSDDEKWNNVIKNGIFILTNALFENFFPPKKPHQIDLKSGNESHSAESVILSLSICYKSRTKLTPNRSLSTTL